VDCVNYSVLFQEFPFDHLEEVSAAVSRVYRIPPFDARAKVRRGWGFLERDVSAAEAQLICNALAEQGIAAGIVANDALRKPAAPQAMTGFEPAGPGFVAHLPSPTAPPRPVAWSEIAIVAAGGFSEEVVRREAADREPARSAQLIGVGLFLMTGFTTPGLFGGSKPSKEETPVKRNRSITFGQIVTSGGEFFCFAPEHFDFSGLGAQKLVNASMNFRLLVSEFVRLSGARTNLGARCLLGNQSLALAGYQSVKDFESELLWLLNTSPAG
jgi:hypothetical protein